MSTSIGIYFYPMGDAQKQLEFIIGKIKDIRTRKSMSQLDLSLKANMSQSFLASVERGKKQPSVLTLLRIAEALDVSPKIFFPESEDMTKEDIKDTIISLIQAL